jgi:Flp pilus assembly protein TadD
MATSGIARLMQGRAADARAELEIASAAEPANADYADNLGVACLTLGDTAAARTAFDRAVALDPGNEEALYYAARLRLNAGERADAVRLLTAARKRGPFQSLDVITLADSLGVGR